MRLHGSCLNTNDFLTEDPYADGKDRGRDWIWLDPAEAKRPRICKPITTDWQGEREDLSAGASHRFCVTRTAWIAGSDPKALRWQRLRTDAEIERKTIPAMGREDRDTASGGTKERDPIIEAIKLIRS